MALHLLTTCRILSTDPHTYTQIQRVQINSHWYSPTRMALHFSQHSLLWTPEKIRNTYKRETLLPAHVFVFIFSSYCFYHLACPQHLGQWVPLWRQHKFNTYRERDTLHTEVAGHWNLHIWNSPCFIIRSKWTSVLTMVCVISTTILLLLLLLLLLWWAPLSWNLCVM